MVIRKHTLSYTCVVLKTYNDIYSVVYVLASYAYYYPIITCWVTNTKIASGNDQVSEISHPAEIQVVSGDRMSDYFARW